jgi:hypothetical protein
VLCVEDRRLPLARQVLVAVGVEQSHVELATLAGAHVDSGGYPTTFWTRRLRSALAIGTA